ncbi:MAG: hypothetical protein ACPGOY_00870 [Rhodospirillaceae bacterium]
MTEQQPPREESQPSTENQGGGSPSHEHPVTRATENKPMEYLLWGVGIVTLVAMVALAINASN